MNKLFLLALAGAVLIGTTVFVASHEATQDVQVSDQVVQLWNQFKKDNHKQYAHTELEQYRFQIFVSNLMKIQKDKTGQLGITPFMDLTQEEFAQTYLTLKVNQTNSAAVSCKADISLSINWVANGKVTGVKNQGQCGSCWAFSTTGSLESALIIAGKANTSLNLSEQQLVDCSTTNSGCNGGLMDRAFTYIHNNGITTNANYPYTATKTACKKITANLYSLSSFTDVAQNCVSDLKIALQKQPVSIAVDASNWNLYRTGVFSNCATSLNHGVLLVGFENNAWIVKNSWGTGWGENGYIRLAAGNTCGLASNASYPNV